MLRPLLACSIDDEEQIAELLRDHGSLFVSEKKDGIRGIKDRYGLRSREDKPIRNIHIQNYFADLPEGLDGEIMFDIDGEEKHPPLEHINSVITSGMDKWPKRWVPRFYAFDIQRTGIPFHTRFEMLRDIQQRSKKDGPLKVLYQWECSQLSTILRQFDNVVGYGGEGICLRAPNAYYKQGRSTLREAALLRFKPVKQGRATIFAMTPLERHVGVQDRNAFGLAKRDSKKSNMQEQDELGALLGRTEFGNVKVGSGFTASQRIEYFNKFVKLVGREFIYEYRDLTHKGVPRNPTFVELCPS